MSYGMGEMHYLVGQLVYASNWFRVAWPTVRSRAANRASRGDWSAVR